MKLTRIAASEFLSFADVDLVLNDGLTAITGPNGSGKTSLARAVDLTGRALHAQWTGHWADLNALYGGAGRFGAQQWHVMIDVELNASEIELLELWLRGCLLYLVGQNNDSETLRLQALILETDDIGAAELFSRGSFEVAFDARARNPWALSWFGAIPTGERVRLRMDRNFALQVGVAETRPSYLESLRNLILQSQEDAEMARGIAQAIPAGLRIPSVVDMARTGGIELALRQLGIDIEPMPIRTILDVLGVDTMTAQRLVGFAQVAAHIFGSNLLVTDNVRRQPRRLWKVSELDSRPDLATSEGLALALFQDKNGDFSARAQFGETQKVFASLMGSESPLDVSVSREAAAVDDGQGLLLTPTLVSAQGDLPLHLSGAGRSEAAHLATLLARRFSVLVLDEPATNLSSTAQRRVVSALGERTSYGSQTVLITHSSPMVPTDLTEIVRLSPTESGTSVTRLGDQEILQKNADLIRNTPVREALFASGVLLTEGETEAAALRVWLAQAKPTLEDAGVLLLDVGGDSALVSYMRVLDALGVPWAALADGPAFQTRLQNYDPKAPRHNFSAAKEYWASRGVHTVAQLFGTGEDREKGEFEAFLGKVDADSWQRAKAAGHGSKPRTGEHFAQHVAVPMEIVDIWEKVLARFRVG
ncbi:MAG: ATP-dependent endonuclease of the family-like protein [Subtercola sp.]|nr:ATP-dependent endonuclease of the family-like protein [Subtercola sp.]